MNKYAQFSKAPEDKNETLLTWKTTFNPETRFYQVVFSDGEIRTFTTKRQATQYINTKFFDLYF